MVLEGITVTRYHLARNSAAAFQLWGKTVCSDSTVQFLWLFIMYRSLGEMTVFQKHFVFNNDTNNVDDDHHTRDSQYIIILAAIVFHRNQRQKSHDSSMHINY